MKAVVTTKYKGIFFGDIVEHDEAANKITIKNAQMCVRFAMVGHGVLGLASVGPNEDCRIGKPVPEATLYEVTAVIPATEEAAKEWAKCHWTN